LASEGESCKQDKSNLEGKIAGLEKAKRGLSMKVSELEKLLSSKNESLKTQAA